MRGNNMYTLKKCNVVKMVESEHERDKLLQKGFRVAGIENATEKNAYVDATELVKQENEILVKANENLRTKLNEVLKENKALEQEIEALKAQTGGDENAGSDTSDEATEDTTASGTATTGGKSDTTTETKGTSRARK